ncbi:hypothetical protein [Mesorhizobium kowhaii]|uniref:hypothetical protein n=1 Tax=Mesorhizobium kowhaii TaxID=1300272 RepID=UPI001FE1E686|nr:hypothetical protein [Mesorhizobium kowhaii]
MIPPAAIAGTASSRTSGVLLKRRHSVRIPGNPTGAIRAAAESIRGFRAIHLSAASNDGNILLGPRLRLRRRWRRFTCVGERDAAADRAVSAARNRDERIKGAISGVFGEMQLPLNAIRKVESQSSWLSNLVRTRRLLNWAMQLTLYLVLTTADRFC